MPEIDFTIMQARALGLAQGKLDSIILTADSGVTHLTDVDQLKERLIAISQMGKDALGRIAQLVPDGSTEYDRSLVQLTCGHWVQRKPSTLGRPNQYHECYLCRGNFHAVGESDARQ